MNDAVLARLGKRICAGLPAQSPIRQFCERPGGEEMAELLMFLEEKEWARRAMIEELQSKTAGD